MQDQPEGIFVLRERQYSPGLGFFQAVFSFAIVGHLGETAVSRNSCYTILFLRRSITDMGYLQAQNHLQGGARDLQGIMGFRGN